MAQYGARDQYSDAPKFVVDAATGQTGQELFGNSVYAVDKTEVGVTAGVAHPGWVYRRVGTGPITAFVITSGGTGYANTDTINVQGGTGANAVGAVATNGTGVITAVTVTDQGQGFPNADAATLTIVTAGGTGANVAVTTGGHSGRIQYETLVASKSIVTDATDFANTSTGAVANTSGTADDAIFPDA